MSANQKANSKRWFDKVKKDPVKYERILARHRIWYRKYRQSNSKKFHSMEQRRRARRALNPFPHREENNAYYVRMKSNPAKHQAYLERRRSYYRARMERFRADPKAYREYLQQSMVYQRYYRIIKKAA